MHQQRHRYLRNQLKQLQNEHKDMAASIRHIVESGPGTSLKASSRKAQGRRQSIAGETAGQPADQIQHQSSRESLKVTDDSIL